MKTSIKLLCLLAVVTLTGMLSINHLLKQQYDKIDWNNPYQNFRIKLLPNIQHVRISGMPDAYEVRVQQGAKPQVLLNPEIKASAVEITQKGDTLLVIVNKKGDGWDGPIDKDWNSYQAALVLNLPALSSLYANNVRAKVSGFDTDQMSLTAHQALLTTEKIRVSGQLTVQTENRAFASLGADTCGTLRVTMRDSSGLNLDGIRPGLLLTDVAPKAELRLKGQQLGVIQN